MWRTPGYYECLRDIDGVIRMVGPFAPQSEVAKYMLRVKWEAIGCDNRTFTKDEVRFVVPGAVEHLPFDNGHKALVVWAKEPIAQSPVFLHKFAQTYTGLGKPAIVVAPPAPNRGAPGGPKTEAHEIPGSFKSVTEAAKAAASFLRRNETLAKAIRSWEYGAGIYKRTVDGHDQFFLTPITSGCEGASGRQYWYVQHDLLSEYKNPLFTDIINGQVDGSTMVAYLHTHPYSADGLGNRFSGGDIDFGHYINVGTAFVLTPDQGLRSAEIPTRIEHPFPAELLSGTEVPGFR